jgi:integrase
MINAKSIGTALIEARLAEVGRKKGGSNVRRTGHIRQRSPGSWEIRYPLQPDPSGERRLATATVRGDRRAAEKELRARLKAVDDNAYVAPDRITVAKWIETWFATIEVDPRTAERYDQLLRLHVVPTLGAVRLQALRASDLETLYTSLKNKSSDRTRRHVHVVFGTCLKAAVRKDMLVRNPVAQAMAPRVERKLADERVGMALSRDQLTKLVQAFRGHPLFPLVVTAIGTGARRSELLALRWSDLDPTRKTLGIERALTEPKQGDRRIRKVKVTKSPAGVRTIMLDDGVIAALLEQRSLHQRIVAGISSAADVDLSLVKLPDRALIFPSLEKGLCELRDANAVTRTFERKARKLLGEPKLRLHDLRHTHGSRLIAAGETITTVAARQGHTPEVLLRIYAHELKAAEEQRASAGVIAALAIEFR